MVLLDAACADFDPDVDLSPLVRRRSPLAAVAGALG
jgi:hypothetical protein